MSGAATLPLAQAWRWIRRTWDRAAIYLPVILMGVLALGTYWLASNTPSFLGASDAARPPTHEPDYFMRGFAVKTFEPGGRLKSEVLGTEARHYPDTDTLEIDNPRMRSWDEKGSLTIATGRRAISNADGSEVQLIDDAVVTREPPAGSEAPRMEIRGEFLHVFVNTEQVRSHKPVELLRGNDRFTANTLDYDHLDRVGELHGRVRGTLVPDPRRR
ncbi:LPS export ABC transporter periplasmic protein LptC [Ramlibacter tataouinensis]|uniref:LPS export ABC transporter periplasmic protein LptC n=1 Tax=Ramlibacter tataouinensis TaxID=94132 RepID=UPI0022F3DC9A|nr:LPS export ABC transporter periplasmic protein LptC [Ramlibacter tataouinensis]WBY00060.1 LPS export ABC transporter periplasmic protein LptC [Ramlibacter tataouinensis]